MEDKNNTFPTKFYLTLGFHVDDLVKTKHTHIPTYIIVEGSGEHAFLNMYFF